uniref:Uncharacterized protein n=1 Tax=Triticum urartu TaxID=4572 RepID=A0A8R7QM77_TRIUA
MTSTPRSTRLAPFQSVSSSPSPAATPVAFTPRRSNSHPAARLRLRCCCSTGDSAAMVKAIRVHELGGPEASTNQSHLLFFSGQGQGWVLSSNRCDFRCAGAAVGGGGGGRARGRRDPDPEHRHRRQLHRRLLPQGRLPRSPPLHPRYGSCWCGDRCRAWPDRQESRGCCRVRRQAYGFLC